MFSLDIFLILYRWENNAYLLFQKKNDRQLGYACIEPKNEDTLSITIGVESHLVFIAQT